MVNYLNSRMPVIATICTTCNYTFTLGLFALRLTGLTSEGDSGEEFCEGLLRVPLWSKAKFKSPCNFEESPYVAPRLFSLLVIYENADIVHLFIEIYRILY